MTIIYGNDAIKQSGIPPEIISRMLTTSVHTPLTIRGTETSRSPNMRFQERFDPKPTAIHQKSSNMGPTLGHIAEDPRFGRIKPNKQPAGVDLTDSSHGQFPLGSKKPTEAFIAQFDPSSFSKAAEVREFNGRLCYKKKTNRYKKVKPNENVSAEIKEYNGQQYIINEKDPIAEKYYIQEIESLNKIIQNIKDGSYNLVNFSEAGILEYSYPEGVNNTFSGSFQVNLTKFLEFDSEGAAWEASIDNQKNETSSDIEIQLNNWLTDNYPNSELSQIRQKPMPVSIKENNQIKPLMVQTGVSGAAVTGDFDLMHLGLPKGMPSIAFEAPNTYLAGGTEYFIKHTYQLRDTLLKAPYKNDPKFTHFQTLAPYNDAQGNKIDPLDEFLDSKWMATQGKLHIGGYLMNCLLNKSIGKKMFCHGEESFNPGKSEDFGAIDHLFKGMIIHTDTEDEYLQVVLNDPDYLASQFLNIHPYCLRVREGNDQVLTQKWMHIIEAQVLQGHDEFIKPAVKQAYDAAAQLLNLPPLAKTSEVVNDAVACKARLDSIYAFYHNAEIPIAPATFNNLAQTAKEIANEARNVEQIPKNKKGGIEFTLQNRLEKFAAGVQDKSKAISKTVSKTEAALFKKQDLLKSLPSEKIEKQLKSSLKKRKQRKPDKSLKDPDKRG